MCVVSKPKNYDNDNSLSSDYNSKSKTNPILLQNYQKLRKIKNQRNRRIKMPNHILAARRALLHRSYSKPYILNRKYLQNSKTQTNAQKRRLTRKINQEKRKTSYLRPDLTLTLVNGQDNLHNLRRKGTMQKLYKKMLCAQSKSHRFCRN